MEDILILVPIALLIFDTYFNIGTQETRKVNRMERHGRFPATNLAALTTTGSAYSSSSIS